ncbi:MAG: Ig-like domain-containing protein, partial [Acidimicrobiales bacterium]
MGQRVTYSATVSPAPNGGTVRFTDDGSTVSGCSAVSVSPGSGTASCSATSSGAGSHEIEAIYSGSAGFAASSSNELTQVVQTTQVTQSGTSGLGFTPLSPPMRIADTRPGATDPTTYAGRTLGPGQSITIDMPASVPSNAGAVVAQLTAIGATRAGYLAAYATGGSRPETANVNFAAGQIVGNLVTVGLGVDTNGALALSIYNGPSGTTDFTLDLYGYYATDTSTAGDGYVPLTPTRIFDTRATSGLAGEGMTLGSGGTATVPVSGVGGVPQNTVGVVVNVAVVDTTAPSYVQGYPTGSPPASSTPTVVENWGPGELLSAKAIIGVGQKGSITFANAAGSTDLVVDVDGYFLPPGSGGALFNPLPTPVRLADTRPDGIPG